MCPHPEKKRYRGRKYAERVARLRSEETNEPLHAYVCECGAWHIGHRRAERRVR